MSAFLIRTSLPQKRKIRIFLICPVRNITPEEKWRIAEYVKKLEEQGHEVHWPVRDTDQNDDIGLRICQDNRAAIKSCNEVHVWWNESSTGSVFDLGMAFALGKKIVLANKDEIKPTPTKSFTNVVLQYS